MQRIYYAMKSLVKLFFEWEIQLLVLLSFTLQLFLFFTGSLRRRNTNMFLRLSIWTSYLGADWVAVYALGYLSRHHDVAIVRHILSRTQPLAFFWAPFLLIHLGGQDTITAFAIEDNNLWLRHFLNLVVQVVLALYVFWKSIGRHSTKLLISGVFVFIAGIIKYGERTWSLKCGSFQNLERSTGHPYKQQLPDMSNLASDHYSHILRDGLISMQNVLNVFARRTLSDSHLSPDAVQNTKRMLKVLELELGMMYDDLYTKALVLRTRIGIIFRCISQISAVIAFVLFLASDKRRYSRADIAITYSLFIGGFFLDLCAMFIFMMSPWTWAWLKHRKCGRLARLSWFLFTSVIGWPERKVWWSNSMGQYTRLNWLAGSDQPKTCSQLVMTVVRMLVNLVGAEKEKLFWMSKLLDTEYVEADEKTMECVVEGISRFRDEFSKGPREWLNIHPLLENTQDAFVGDFGCAIVGLHVFTQRHLSKYPPPSDMEANEAADTDVMVEVCRKLSNYMMYLFVAHPSMLPLNTSAVATMEEWEWPYERWGSREAINQMVREAYGDYDPKASKETLQEMVDMWTRLLIYAAGKSRPEAHAALLARRVEPITLAWLLMAQQGLGDSELKMIRIANDLGGTSLQEVCAFDVRKKLKVIRKKKK